MGSSLVLLFMLACSNGDGTTPADSDVDTDTTTVTGTDTGPEDADQDGHDSTTDCNDEDATVYPGAEELCNGVDDNCNQIIDEGFEDTDKDEIADCIDVEDCDGEDNDGDGVLDEGFADTDEDGLPDCLDEEICDGLDNDGDSTVDEGMDIDGDGYPPCGDQPDCDDGDATRSPEASEIDANEIDDDCDVLIDEGYWAAGDLIVTEVMVNPGAVGDPLGEWIEIRNESGRTLRLEGLTLVSDGDAQHVVEHAEELRMDADAIWILGTNADWNTNGRVNVDYPYSDLSLSNESDRLEIWAGATLIDEVAWDDGYEFPDPDGASLSLDPYYQSVEENDRGGVWCASTEPWDEFSDLGSPGQENLVCPDVDHDGDGYSSGTGDCDESDPSIHPGAVETWYDGIDQDCNELSDYDSDLDGHDSDLYLAGTDCDDNDATISPDADEICDGIDNDCDGDTDPDDSIDALNWYRDSDGDSDGDPTDKTTACSQPSGYVSESSDCDDTDPSVYDCTVGLNQENPGLDCNEIHQDDSTLTDGIYWIDPDGDEDHSNAFEAYCDMTVKDGGWTLFWFVDAEHFDGTFANDRVSSTDVPTEINEHSDMWNVLDEVTASETLVACTDQDDTNTWYWYYNNTDLVGFFTGTGSYGYQYVGADDSNTTYATCVSTHKAEDRYGFIVLENGSCGSCNTMLYGNYHYTSGGQCNSTSNIYGTHNSPWDGRSIGYPICGGTQTSNGSFWMGVR